MAENNKSPFKFWMQAIGMGIGLWQANKQRKSLNRQQAQEQAET